MIAFAVLGPPAPAGSKQAFVRGGKAIVTDASRRSRPWKSQVSVAAQEAMNGRPPLEGPLYLRLTFGVKRPVKHYRANGELGAEGLRKPWPSSRPDAIKLGRAVEDALSGIVYADDAQIVLEAISKHYANAEGVVIEVLELPQYPTHGGRGPRWPPRRASAPSAHRPTAFGPVREAALSSSYTASDE